MDLRQVTEVLEGESLTGRQAALVVAVWLGLTAVFGIVVFAL